MIYFYAKEDLQVAFTPRRNKRIGLRDFPDGKPRLRPLENGFDKSLPKLYDSSEYWRSWRGPTQVNHQIRWEFLSRYRA